MSELLIATVVVLLTVLFGSIIIHENLNKPTYEIRFIEGCFVIRHRVKKTHIKRFKTNEEAIEWYNENCI
jgi:hypothetical protein